MSYVTKLFAYILVVYHHMGYLDENKRLIAFFVISVPTITIILTAYNICLIWSDLDEAIFNLFLNTLLAAAVVRAFAVITKQQKFVNIYKVVEDWYHDLELDEDNWAFEKLQKFTRNSRRFSRYALRAMVSCAIFVALQPILTNYGKFVFGIALPGIDIHQSPVYEIFYVFQIIWVLPVATCSYVAYVNSFLIFISFGIFMLKHLQRKLENLCQMDEEEALRNIKKCIKCHIKIIKFRDDLEELFSATCLVDVSMYCLVICMMLVYSMMDFEITLFLKGLQLLLVKTVLIFSIFHLANNFSYESLKIAHAAYATNWMERDIEFRKCVLLIIARSQRPLQLTAGGFKPLTMEVFLAIVRASYSVFSLLQSIM